MTPDRPVLYFDFVDPLCRLMARELASLEQIGPDGFDWRPFELRPPPTPLTTLDDPELRERWTRAGETDPGGRAWAPPLLVPWTRKAHELLLHAEEGTVDEGTADEGTAEEGAADEDAAEEGAAEDVAVRAAALREALMDAYLLEGRDIGRVDVLVDIARGLGLDPGEVKPVLDVDRYEADVVEARAGALDAGVETTPSLACSGRVLRGFHNAAAIRTFLGT